MATLLSTENWPCGSKGVYLLFYHAESSVPAQTEAVYHSKKPIRHVRAPASVKPPTALMKPTTINLTAVNCTKNCNESPKLTSPAAGAAAKPTDSVRVKNTMMGHAKFKTSRADAATKTTNTAPVKNATR